MPSDKVPTWVTEHIVSREKRGKEWRDRLDTHKDLAKHSRYIRILGRGFRPVSISAENPCGRLLDKDGNSVKRCDTLEVAISNSKTCSEKQYSPKSDKPEQRVQAFLIRTAMQNWGTQIELQFDSVFPRFDDFDELIFITDELAVNSEETAERCRVDIIALARKNDGYFPIFIELKNDRLLSGLRRQLDQSHKMLWDNVDARDAFKRFLSAVSRVPVCKIRNEARKMIIWPKSTSGKEAPAVAEARDAGFLIVEFEKSGETSFRFIRETPSVDGMNDVPTESVARRQTSWPTTPTERTYGGWLPDHCNDIIPYEENSTSEADDILFEAEGQDAVDEMHVASWARFVRHMETDGTASNPCVGLFWLIEDQLLTVTTPLLEARLQGSFLTHAVSRLDAWKNWQRFGPKMLAQRGLPPEIASTEHTSHPHGRVVFCWEAPAFVVYADRAISASDAMMTRVLDAFGLDPAECLLRSTEDARTVF